MKRVGIYLRVSTDNQTTENQRRELNAVAGRSGWQIVGTYEDAGISGTKGREQRPGFDRLLKDATARKVDMIAAWSVDRLGRSLQDLVGFLTELQALRCDLYLHQQALDTSTPSGRAMFQMCGVFAEFERGMIRERVNAGLARARARGTKQGSRRDAASVGYSGRAFLPARSGTAQRGLVFAAVAGGGGPRNSGTGFAVYFSPEFQCPGLIQAPPGQHISRPAA